MGNYIFYYLFVILCYILFHLKIFFVYIQNPAEHSFMIIFILSVALFLVYDIVLWKKTFVFMYVLIQEYNLFYMMIIQKQVTYDFNRGGKIYENGAKSIFKIKQWSNNEECTTLWSL